ncbi:hypothetical protein M2480_003130 [Parabacteroides sp. PFB2-12]|uniref:fimbrial tip adhesin FimD n=1 Tax=unclassified Parabacteroides TaxID=2649774 RepID=UPI002474949D|nr:MULTISPECIES: hypothetical protein [unclassified Parabacteroides]MDH6344215.1 hypothetical protein [Parabacteroides sp. PM6-13]MDH6392122.1 hypothetical protein [Parabacteroides sp. PFB2-12]
MKLKNIYLLILLAGIFYSCTEEEPIRLAYGAEGIPTTLDVVVSTEGINTKAAGDNMLATEAELQINNLAVAAFKVTEENVVGKFLGFVYAASPVGEADDSHTNEDGTEGRIQYSVSGLTVETGFVQILAIANSSLTKEQFEAKFTKDCVYSDVKKTFEEAITQTADAYVFEADELVKFADVKKTIVEGANVLHIELTQLASRVDVYMNFLENMPETAPWTFEISEYTLTGVNVESDVFLGAYGATYTYNSKKSFLGGLKKEYAENAGRVITKVDEDMLFSFYTYERETADKSLKLNIKGVLTDVKAEEEGLDGAVEEKEYNLIINPVAVAGSTVKTTNGIIHGYLYDVFASIDVKTKNILFNYQIIDWIDRMMGVHIIPIYYLQVKDLEISMPNLTNSSTTYQSSSNAFIVEGSVKVYKQVGIDDFEEDDDHNIQITLTGQDGTTTSGDILITGDVPGNFVPRKIEFVVRNLNGLEQKVVVMQYPPLYITFEKSGSTGEGSSGQTNYNYYKFTSLVANFSAFPYPDEFNEKVTYRSGSQTITWGDGVNDHSTARKEDGYLYTDYIRENAKTGYPILDESGYVIDSEENNRLVSPNFMLASQAGVISNNTYNNHRDRCKSYSEKDAAGNTLSGWRMPTLAELYLIDIMQNYKACIVKRILEGSSYWSANQDDGPVMFMDYRVQDGTSTRGSVRCVRDIK